MHLLEFTLKQHTPIIHFQHDQDGATLRATEVKPKLDRYIIEKLGGKDKMEKSWFNNFEKGSLDYKMRIEPIGELRYSDLIEFKVIPDQQGRKKFERGKDGSFPTFFGNMMKLEEFEKDKPYKKFLYYDTLKLTIVCFNTALKDKLNSIKEDFFFEHNFGTRQSKGFGSFEVVSNIPTSAKYSFFIENVGENQFKKLFESIDLFYKCLKSGLNIKTKINNQGPLVDKMYFKSLMFQYAKSLSPPAQWDKRTIRDFQFQNHAKYKKQSNQIQNGVFENRTTLDGTVHFNTVLPANPNTYFDFRDLLGLSSEQDWIYYDRAKITKKVTYKEVNSEGIEETIEAERFNSPLMLKPIFDETEKKWKVSMVLKNIPENYLGSNVEVRCNKLNPQNLTIYPQFNLNGFIEFAIRNFDINHVDYGNDYGFNTTPEAKIVNNIFKQLKGQ